MNSRFNQHLLDPQRYNYIKFGRGNTVKGEGCEEWGNESREEELQMRGKEEEIERMKRTNLEEKHMRDRKRLDQSTYCMSNIRMNKERVLGLKEKLDIEYGIRNIRMNMGT